MDPEKQAKLEARGWKIGDAKDFLNLKFTEEEALAALEIGLALEDLCERIIEMVPSVRTGLAFLSTYAAYAHTHRSMEHWYSIAYNAGLCPHEEGELEVEDEL